MPLKFRKRIRLLPGIWLNISKSGVSTSIGGKGATVNIGKQGTKSTLSIPGTGLSYTHTETPEQLPPETSRTSGPLTRPLVVVLWIFLIGYLAWVMH